MTTFLTLHLARSTLLTANQRLHWRRKAELTRGIRDHTALLAWRLPAFFDRQHITVTYRFPDRRKRDAANWHPTTKAIIDGLVDARVLPDDSDRWVEGPDNRLGHPHVPDDTCGSPRIGGCVLIEIRLKESATFAPEGDR